jgi:acetyltransferase-like isoleucine patch superfamily enzyme
MAIHGRVQVGERLRLGSGTVIRSFHGLVIGDDVAIGRNCTVEVDGTIGAKTVIAANVGIVGRADHAVKELGRAVVDSTWIGDREAQPADAIRIGRDVWVGYGATLLSGCSIGDCAIIAAGSVVVHDVPPFAIVAGTPAKRVGERFSSADQATHLTKLFGDARKA